VVTAIVLFSSLSVALRVHTYHEPLGRDIAAYAVIAHEMLAGRALYADLWDHKPPAVHATFAVGEWLCGYGPKSIYLLNVAAVISTLLGIYAAGTAYAGDRRTGLWAALFWALLSNNLHLEANQPNTEVFINPCLVMGFALFVKANRTAPGLGRFALAGLLAGLASLYKQVALAPVLLMGCASLFFNPGKLITGRRRRSLEMALMIGTVALLWLVLFSYFAFRGHWNEFCEAVFTYNRHYGENMLANLIVGLHPHLMLGQAPLVAPVLHFLAGVGCLLGIALRASPLGAWILWVAYAIGAYAAIHLPGHWHPHYYQLWLPVLAIGAAWGLSLLQGIIRDNSHAVRPWVNQFSVFAFGLVAAAQLAIAEGGNNYLPAEQWSRIKYGTRFIEMQRLGKAIGELLAPDESLYVFGPESEIYFYSQRRPVAGVLYSFPLLGGPLVDKLTQRTLAQLQASPPEMVVICFDAGPQRSSVPIEPEELARSVAKHPVVQWCLKHYTLYPQLQAGPSVLCYVRRGGALARRVGLSESGAPETK
jgi:hypothetical protein